MKGDLGTFAMIDPDFWRFVDAYTITAKCNGHMSMHICFRDIADTDFRERITLAARELGYTVTTS